MKWKLSVHSFASVTSTGFMHIGWELWLWLLRCILLHFCLSWLVLHLLVSFSAHLKKIFPAQNKHCCATSWELICGSLEGTGSSFTTLTRNKHAHLLAFWPLYWKSKSHQKKCTVSFQNKTNVPKPVVWFVFCFWKWVLHTVLETWNVLCDVWCFQKSWELRGTCVSALHSRQFTKCCIYSYRSK